MMERNKIVQKNTFNAVLACLFLNTGVVLSTLGSGTLIAAPAVTRTIFGAAMLLGSRVPFGLIQLQKMDKYNERYGMKM